MLSIEPGEWVVWVEGRLPDEGLVGLQLHAEEGKGQTGEVVIVDAGVDKGRGHVELAHIFLDAILLGPKRQGRPVLVKGGVIGHAAVDVVFQAGFLCGIRQGATYGEFVSPVCGVDKGQIGILEEGSQEGLVIEGAGHQGDVVEVGQLLCDDALALVDLGADMPADGGSDTDEAGSLTAGAVNGDDELHNVLVWHA